MDMGSLHLFIKMIKLDYNLSDADLETLRNRMLADDREFEKVWKTYKNKARKTHKGVDQFQSMLNDLLG
jgi:hypothetical protein